MDLKKADTPILNFLILKTTRITLVSKAFPTFLFYFAEDKTTGLAHRGQALPLSTIYL